MRIADDGGVEYTASCTLSAGSGSEDNLSVIESVSSAGSSSSSQALPMMALTELPTGGTVELRCHSAAKIVAVQVSTTS